MANDSKFEASGVYINYDAFELICYDVGQRSGNIEIELSREEAKAICNAIGLLGFTKARDGKAACVYNAPVWEKNNAGHLSVVEEENSF